MATPQEYLERAVSYIGIGGTDNIFNTWVWGFHCYDPNMYPWCAAFQSYIGIHDLGMPFNASASAAGVAWQGTPVDASAAAPGDWVLFNWDGRGDFSWADHIAVVEWSDINGSGYFGTIDGNSGGGEGVVQRNTYSTFGGYSVMFFRPPYDGGESEDDVMGLYDVHESAAAEIGGVPGSTSDMVDWIDARVKRLAEPHESVTGDGTVGSMPDRIDYIDMRVRDLAVNNAALSEAVKALASAKGANPQEIAKAVDKAVKARLEKIKLNVSAK